MILYCLAAASWQSKLLLVTPQQRVLTAGRYHWRDKGDKGSRLDVRGSSHMLLTASHSSLRLRHRVPSGPLKVLRIAV